MDTRSPFKQAWGEHWRLHADNHTPLWFLLLISTGAGLVLGAVIGVLAGWLGAQLGTARWWNYTLPANVITMLCVCYTFQLVRHGLQRALPRATLQRLAGARDWRAALFYTVYSMFCVALGFAIALWVMSWVLQIDAWHIFTVQHFSVPQFIVTSIVISALVHLITKWRWKQQQQRLKASEAQLRLLQAQIEPHFLFNTLANVQSLIDVDAPLAKRMLEAFTDYLRASLQHLRSDSCSLAQELDMAESYLSLMQARMADRLAFHIEASEAARGALLPPLLLQPLIENAIHHGLEPKLEGGRIDIEASVEQGLLRIRVQDDGLGLGAPRRAGRRGHGMALANIRARLQTRYGERARLLLQAAEPGAIALLELPYETK